MEQEYGRNLGLDLVRVTEVAALAAGRWLGKGQYEDADKAATEAMLAALNTLDIDGRIVLGEENKIGRLTLLRAGQKVGSGHGLPMDVIADPVDGARLLMHGRSGAISVVGVAPAGSMWSPQSAAYMEKIVVDEEVAAGLVPECLEAPVAWTLALISRLKKKPVDDLIVFMLERDRHTELIDEIRHTGAKVWLRADGDIAGALIAASPNTDIDALIGTGGALEGILVATAVKAMEGGMLARLDPQSELEKEDIKKNNLDTKRILTVDELISHNDAFFAATGVTDGPILRGVKYSGDYVETESIILRAATGTRRVIYSKHSVKRLFMML